MAIPPHAEWPGQKPRPESAQNGAAHEFLWGVATSAYQHEGGFNGDGEPQNNWAWAERDCTVDPSGGAAEFWNRAEQDFERCRTLGLNSFRLSLAWERIQPTYEIGPNGGPSPHAPPSFDENALDRYAAILCACRKEGLEPVVTLHHFTHPAWLGVDAWLNPRTIDFYLLFVEKTVGFLLDVLPQKYATTPPSWFITINEPNLLAASTYFNGIFPAGARTAKNPMQAVTCLSHLVEAHVRAYRLIHRLYRERGMTRELAPKISFNNYCSDLYWADEVWIDLLFAPSRGIERRQLFPYLWKQAWLFEKAFRKEHLPIRSWFRFWSGQALKRIHYFVACACSFERAWGRLLDVLYNDSEPSDPPLDFIAIDYYDPFVAHLLRWPRWSDLFHKYRQRRVPIRRPLHERFLDSITNKWWDWRLLPEGLSFFVRVLERFNLPIMIAENGMATRADASGDHERSDKLLRSNYLQKHIAMVGKLRAEGWPLIGYLHWSLVDNYEWGSYAPRFGLYTREREAVDFRGDNPSATYAHEITEARQASSDECQR